MGLHRGSRPSGLASLLSESPPPDASSTPLTSLNVHRLEGSLAAAVNYVVGGSGGDATPPLPPLVRDGHIDFRAVEQAVHHAVQAVAGQSSSSEEEQDSEQQAAGPGSGSGGSDSGAAAPTTSRPGEDAGRGAASLSGTASPDVMPPLLADSRPSSPQAAGAPPASSGRLGPAEVTLVEARGSCDVRGCCALSRTNFCTLRSSACVFKGRWMYEVHLGSAGIMQLGWTTLQARFNSEEGVGDTHDSYAYDGRRKMRWHVSSEVYGEHWAAGDVIGCCIDLDGGTMHFLRNGKDLGVAFTNVRRGMPGMAYFAGISLSYSEHCEVNFGARPFLHAVEGYQPLQQSLVQPVPLLEHRRPYASPAEERQGQVAAARYLAGCLARLLDVSSPAPAQLGAGEAAAAEGTDEAAAADATAGGVETPAAGQQPGEEEEALASTPLMHATDLLPGSAGARQPLGGRLLPDADVLAALAAAAGQPGSSKGAAGAGSLPSGAAADGAITSGPAIRMDDRVLLGSVLAQYLGPLCFDPYIVEAVLLPLLDDTAGDLSGGSGAAGGGSGEGGGGDAAAAGSREPAAAAAAAPPGGESAAEHASEAPAAGPAAATGAAPREGQELGRQRLLQLLELLVAVLEPEELSALVLTCGQVMARRVRACVWDLRELPASDAQRALHLWSALLDCPEVISAWLASGEWRQQLEGMLAVWQPSEGDLQQLMHHLKVTWGEGGSAVVRNRREDRNQFTKDLGNIAAGLEQVEAAQADILLQLWLHPSSSPTTAAGVRASPGASPPPGSSTQAEPAPQQHNEQQRPTEQQQPLGQHLRDFLQHLIEKNRGAMMHVPPPGLSDQTCLVSAIFATLRLMNEQAAAMLPSVPTLRWDPATTFLQGGALGAGNDPYYDAGRLGGTLSHLAREHPPSDEDRQPLEGLPLGALVKYDAALRLRPRALDGPSFSDAWLHDRLLMLCHLSAAPLMRGGLNHLSSMQAAMAGLRAVAASIEESGSTRVLQQTRREYQQEFERALRQHEWAQCWLLSSWRQQAAFLLSVSTVQLVEAVASQRAGLLRYVPELYLTAPLDMVHAVHKCEPAVLDHKAMMGLGLRHVVEFVVAHLDDDRIKSPEVQGRLVQMVLEAVQELDLLVELSLQNEVARRHLLPAMMRLFSRPHLWGQASNFFALLVEGFGFLHPPAAFGVEFEDGVGALRDMFKQACLADPDLCSSFLHHLFDYSNRMLTELVASLESVDNARSRPGGGAPSGQLLRLLASTAEYSLVLLRTLELMAAQTPEVFLEASSDMNLTRVAEVLCFALPQFVSGRAHRLLQRLSSSRPLAQQLRLRSTHLLQPLAGILVALCHGEAGGDVEGSRHAASQEPGAAGSEAVVEAPAGQGAEELEQQAQPFAPRRRSLLRLLAQQAAVTGDVLRSLVDRESLDNMVQAEPLSADEAATLAERTAQLAALQAGREQDVRCLEQTVATLLAARQAAAAASAASSGGGEGQQGSKEVEPPEEFLDPILSTLMQDPVVLPDSRITLDRSTIERHLLSSATDPFSRAPLTKDQLIPNTELWQQIETWRRQHLPA